MFSLFAKGHSLKKQRSCTDEVSNPDFGRNKNCKILVYFHPMLSLVPPVSVFFWYNKLK